MPIVAAAAIDGKLDGAGIDLDDAGAAHARYAAGRGATRRDPRFEPADGVRIFSHRIGERPGATARITLAACRAQRRVTGARGCGRIVAARPVVADLGGSRHTCPEKEQPAKQPKRLNSHTFAHKAAPLPRLPPHCRKPQVLLGQPTTDSAGCRAPVLGFAP